MKKILSLAIALSMMLSLCSALSLGGFAVSTKGETPAVDSVVTIAGMNIGVDDAGATCEITGSSPYKLTRKASGDIKLVVTSSGTDATSCDALEFWIDTTEYSPSSSMPFALYFRDSSWRYNMQGGCTYKLLVDGIWETRTSDEFGRFILPAAYAGYVRIMIDTITGVGFDAFTCFAIITSENPLGGTGKSMYMDGFRFVKEAQAGSGLSQPAAPAAAASVPFLDGFAGKFDNNCGSDSVSVVEAANSKNLIKIKAGAASSEPGMHKKLAASVDASGKKFFQFYLDTTNAGNTDPLPLGLRLWDSTANGGADIYAAGGKVTFKLYDGSVWATKTVGYDSRMAIPVGFKGYVRVDMTQFYNCTTGYNANGEALDMSKVDEITVWFNAASAGQYIFVNDFCFVDSAALTQMTAPAAESAIAFLDGTVTGIGASSGNPADSVIYTEAAGEKTLIAVEAAVAGCEPGLQKRLSSSVDASGKRFFQFYLDTTAAGNTSPLPIGLRLWDSTANGGADIYAASGKVNFWLYDGEAWTLNTVSDNRMNVPAAFKGYVRVDMTQFYDCTTGYNANGDPLDMSKVDEVALWFNASKAGQVIYVNDLQFVDGATVAAPAEADVLSDIYADGGYYGTSYAEAAKGELVFMTAFDMTVLNNKASVISKVGMYVYSSANTANKDKWFTAEATLTELGEKDGKLAVIVSDIAAANFSDDAAAVPYILFKDGTLLVGTGDRAAAVSVSDFSTQCLGK